MASVRRRALPVPFLSPRAVVLLLLDASGTRAALQAPELMIW